MTGSQVAVPLQIICRLMVAGQAGESMTLPLFRNSSLGEKNDSLVLPHDYVEIPEIGFAYRLSENKLTHNEARKSCLRSNGQLAVIDSREKVDQLFSYFPEADHVHVGLIQDYDTEEWITVDGKSTNILPWASEEPRGGYRCGKLSKGRNGLYNFGCLGLDKYLCEIALPRN